MQDLKYIITNNNITMKHFYYKKELNKGYLPSDKAHHNGQPYEKTSGDAKLREMFASILAMYPDKNAKSILHDIDTVLGSYLDRINYKPTTNKPFYVNLNRDGIDLYAHRWAWEPK